jgi:hypothetical protein
MSGTSTAHQIADALSEPGEFTDSTPLGRIADALERIADALDLHAPKQNPSRYPFFYQDLDHAQRALMPLLTHKHVCQLARIDEKMPAITVDTDVVARGLELIAEGYTPAAAAELLRQQGHRVSSRTLARRRQAAERPSDAPTRDEPTLEHGHVGLARIAIVEPGALEQAGAALLDALVDRMLDGRHPAGRADRVSRVDLERAAGELQADDRWLALWVLEVLGGADA